MLGVISLCMTFAVGTAGAFEPTKPVDFVIMAGKGGGADKMARLMQSIVESNDLAGRPLVPVNKSGGSGAEALVALQSATDPDHTIMVTLNSFFTTPFAPARPRCGYHAVCTNRTNWQKTPSCSGCTRMKDVNSFQEFLDEAMARGSGWVMGGTGSAQEDQIITDFLNDTFGLEIKYIPYKGGGAVAKDLAGEQIDSSVNNPSEALGFYESGDVIPLVAFTSERLPMFPDVPTLAEAGSDFAYYMQRAVVGAPGMSDEALAYYTDLFAQVYESEEWQKYKSDKSLLGDYLSGDGLRGYWEEQRGSPRDDPESIRCHQVKYTCCTINKSQDWGLCEEQKW